MTNFDLKFYAVTMWIITEAKKAGVGRITVRALSVLIYVTPIA
jgi:hypothetical protein